MNPLFFNIFMHDLNEEVERFTEDTELDGIISILQDRNKTFKAISHTLNK